MNAAVTPFQYIQAYDSQIGAYAFSGDVRVDAEHPLTAPDQQTAELVLTLGSWLRNRTLTQAIFDRHCQLIPLKD